MTNDPAIWSAIVIGALGTFVWRFLGVTIASRVRADSPLFIWIGCVAYAMVAGLMARVLLMPGGDMDLDAMMWRAAAFLVGFVTWFLTRKSVPFGLLGGVGAYAGIVAAGL